MKKLKITSLILAVLMVVSMLPLGMVSAFAAEIASQPDYKIGTAEEFVEFMNNWLNTANYYYDTENNKPKTVVLTADIDLSGVKLPKFYKAETWEDTQNTYTHKKLNSFTGIFDGQGHTISGYELVSNRSDGVKYTIKSSGATKAYNINDGVALFGYTVAKGDTATIKNVTLAGATCKGYNLTPKAGASGVCWDVGMLYGSVNGTLNVENVTVSGVVCGRSVGGLVETVGATANVTVKKTDFSGTVAHGWVGNGGGFFGTIAAGAKVYVENSTFSGDYEYLVTDMTTDAGAKNSSRIGGFVGVNKSANVEFVNCKMGGSVVSHLTVILLNGEQDHYIGGFVGQNSGTINFTDCTVSGTVKANVNMNATIDTAKGKFNAPQIGGFIGYSDNSGNTLTFTNCEMSGAVSTTCVDGWTGWHHTGGFVANIYDPVTFVNCTLSGSVTSAMIGDPAGTFGSHTGGFAGQVKHTTTLDGCIVTDTALISGSGVYKSRHGGLIGNAESNGSVIITNSSMGGKVTTTGTGSIGGLIGATTIPVTLTECSVSGTVESTATSGSIVGQEIGGLIGLASATTTMDRCSVGGVIKSTAMFANASDDSSTTDVNEQVKSSWMGGFAGYVNNNLTISNSVVFADFIVNDEGFAGGFIAYMTGTNTVLDMDDCVMLGTITRGFKSSDYYTTYQDSKGNDVTHAQQRQDRSAGIVGNFTGATYTMTNVAFYGNVTLTTAAEFAVGFVSNSKPTTSGYLEYCLFAGSVTQSRPYFNSASKTSGNYNAQINGIHNGPNNQANKDSAYTYVKNGANTSSPYGYSPDWTIDKVTDANFDASIDALKTSDSSKEAAFDTEKAEAITGWRKGWTFTTGLPIPKGCEDLIVLYTADNLLWFANKIQAGNRFDGWTIKLGADVTLNEGWTASAAPEKPATVWPVTAGKFFAGTFDGQGHTLSGIYLATTGASVGIFGNIAQGTKATVKNVAVVNSYVSSDGQGLGGIFGEVQNEVNATDAQINDPTYVNKTKAVIDNVYADIQVINKYTSSSNSNLGTGGFVGGARADVSITDSAFVGTVNGGGFRGTSPFIGAIRPLEANSKTYFRTVATIENCYAKAELIDLWGCIGGIVGYANACTTFNVTNVILDCEFTSAVKNTEKCGYFMGCSYWNNGAPLADGMKPEQDWHLNNVTYVTNDLTNSASGATVELRPFGWWAGKVTVAWNGAAATGLGTASTKADAAAANTASQLSKFPGVATEAELPAVLYAWDFQMSVTLTDDLAVNLYADEAYTVLNDKGVASVDVTKKNGEVKMTYNDILPQQIGDDFTIELGASDVTVNIKDYLVKLLADEKAQDVAADLLRYGAAAQVKANYNVDALVTDGVALGDLGTSFDAAAMEVVAPVTANKQNIAGVALRLENALALVAKDAEGNVIATTSLNADQMDKNITLTAEDGSTVEVSVAWYVQQALNGGVDEQVDLDLIAAIYAYGLSAAAYNA